MRYFIYNNGDARNHGCEAIIRSSINMICQKNDEIGYTTFDYDSDVKYEIDKICNLLDCKINPLTYRSLKYLFYVALLKAGFNLYSAHVFKKLIQKAKGWDVAISVGGDNYCYKNAIDNLSYINKQVAKKIPKMVLWGVSIEPELMQQLKVVDDLKRYDAIFCRESITYDAVIGAGVTKNVFLYPDPAFTLEVQPVSLPAGFLPGNTIGINLSPLVEAYGNSVFDNYVALIEHIIANTECAVALIPHVVMPGNDDRTTLDKLYERFKHTNRVILIQDMNCMQLKYIISQCRFFIGARTHATIAAYSTCVPTLVAGYSVKAKGIAKDLFGAWESYVVPVQGMQSTQELTDAFKHLFRQEDKIRQHLQAMMPDYIRESHLAGEKLKKL